MQTEKHHLALGFIGDLMLGRQVSEAAARRAPESFWGDVLPSLRGCDAVFANLETPITAQRREWRRCWKAFRFRADPRVTDVLRAGNVQFVSLANNHILDFENEGLLDTMVHLDAAAIAWAGAGRNSAEAMRPAVLQVGDVKVAVIAFTNTLPEFAASANDPGTNHLKVRADHITLGLLDLLVRDLRRQGVSIVVVSVHWGPNLRPWPPRRYRAFAHAVMELDVDVFHGHSAHLLQGIERRGRGVILYDTGDFLDDYWVFPGIRTDRSILFIAEFEQVRLRRLRLIPVSLSSMQTNLAAGGECEAIRRLMQRRSRRLGSDLVETKEGLMLEISTGVAVQLRGFDRDLYGPGDRCSAAPGVAAPWLRETVLR